MLTVVMIDDQNDVIKTVEDHLKDGGTAIAFHSSKFEDANALIEQVRPDVIILDWFLGNPATGQEEGKNSRLTVIWDAWFCLCCHLQAQARSICPPEPRRTIRVCHHPKEGCRDAARGRQAS